MELGVGTAIVTGAGSGLGRMIALVLARYGGNVVVADVDGASAAVADEIRAAGGQATAVTADVCRTAGVDAVLEVAPAPTVLVNNAGGWGGFSEHYPASPTAAWDAVLNLNLRAPMVLTQRCLEPMARAGGGAVVNISSSAGNETTAYACPEYAVAKAGLIRLTTTLAGLAQSHQVRVSCIVPGWIGLPRAHRELAALPADERARTALVPPEEVAASVLDLVRDPHSAGRALVLEGRAAG